MRTSYFVGAFLITLASSVECDIEKVESNVIEECVQKTSVGKKTLKEFIPGPDADSDVLEYLRCTFQGLGYFDSNGKLNLEKIKQQNFVEGDDIDKKYECLSKIDKVEKAEDMIKVMKCTNPENFSN